ncbi:hypothetical protein Btru_036129 [Bulinus truncatus]|nr:hypothetical protein Btru_036129 [Bulinus truncatus]
MKKASKSSRGGGSSYSFSADDSHNNSIYQIRTNHQRKSIPYTTSNSDDSQPSIVWVNPDNKRHHESYRESGDYVTVPPNTRAGTYEMRESDYKKSPASTIITDKSNPQEVRMVLQARGSPPVELAAKILSQGEPNERAQKRSVSGSVKSHRELSTTSAKDSFQGKLRSASVVSSRAPDRLSIKEGGHFSQASDDSYEGVQWYPREGVVEEENCDEHVVYCPEQSPLHGGGVYYPENKRANKRKPRRSCMLPVVCDRSQVAQTQTNAELATSKCDLRVTNKNCNDSKTCDCCAETPKKYSTIYLCEKHPRDSRTYCCKEVVDRDLSPLSNVVYVSPSRISRKSACECVHHETPPPNRRMSCSTCVSQHSKTPPVCIKPSTGEECRCVRRFAPRNPCKDNKCTEEIKKLVTNFFPNLLTLVCVGIKYLLIILLYLLLLWILKMYTAMNHYAHLALLSANLLMLFILFFEPDCLYIYLLSSS